MPPFVLRSPFESVQKLARSHLTLRGPRAYADTHDVALSLLAGAPSCQVIDVGAGRGELSARLARLGHEVTAVERYTEQFEAEVPLVEADADRELPFGDESVDAVMAIEILEHLENPRGFLRETRRVLRPGGVAIVSTPNLTSLPSRLFFTLAGQWDLFLDHPWRLRDPYSEHVQGHITPMPRWLLEHHARDAGFSVEARAYSRAWLPGLPWKLNPLPRGPGFGRILVVRLRKEGRVG